MSTYPALNAMGIQNPKEIARYALFMVNNTDILRVVYDRKKGSILPVSKNFKFPMLKKSTMVDSGTRKTELIYESSAEFRNALSELSQLMDARDSSENLGKLIDEEIHSLEEDVASRIAYIKSLVDKI